MIEDHVFRIHSGATKGNPIKGKCCWLGTCGKTEEQHISKQAFRRRKRAKN